MGNAYKSGTNTTKYIKIKSGRSGVKHAADYISDEKKTVNPVMEYMANDLKTVNPENLRHLLSGINCRAESAAEEFRITEEKYHLHKSEKLKEGQKANEAYHVVLSYKGTDIDPEKIHEMGQEFARRVCGKEYQALVATHLNTGNYHNHVLINAYSMDGTHKFRDSYHLYNRLREIANEISLEHNLPILMNGKETWNKDKEARKMIRILNSDYVKNNYQVSEISQYDEYGRKRGIIELILEFIRVAIQEGLTRGLISGDNVILSLNEIKKIDETVQYCEANNIPDIDTLNERIRALHKEYAPYKSEINNLESFIKNAEKAGEDAYKLTPAQLCPMQPKTKSDLFKTIHDSDYMLTRKFKDISEDEGRNIIKAIRAEQKENLPDGCIYGRYPANKRTEFSPKQENDESEKERFRDVLKEKKELLQQQKDASEPIKIEISELYKVKMLLEQYNKYDLLKGQEIVGNSKKR